MPFVTSPVSNPRRPSRGLRICARSVGGVVPRARIAAGARSVVTRLGARRRCRVLRVRASVVRITGRDRFGHEVAAERAVA